MIAECYISVYGTTGNLEEKNSCTNFCMPTILPYREKNIALFGYLKVLFHVTRWKERGCNGMANIAG